MHLLAAKPGGFNDDEGIVDLDQTPGDVVVLCSQDSVLGLLAETVAALPPQFPRVRLANVVHLSRPSAYDLYEHKVLQHARVIVVSVLGGMGYWRYGLERLGDLSARRSLLLVAVPGDDQPDPDLDALCSCETGAARRVWRYLREGGRHNAHHLFRYLAAEFFTEHGGAPGPWEEPRTLPRCSLYAPGGGELTLDEWRNRRRPDFPVAVLVFYRSHLQTGNTAAFDQLCEIMCRHLDVLPVAVASLKDPWCLQTLNHLVGAAGADVIVNTTSFSQNTEGNASLSSLPRAGARMFEADVPVIQAILAANTEDDWRTNPLGLRARDIAMNVALPEFDGRIISRAVTFKNVERHAERTELDIIRYRTEPGRAAFVAELAGRWAALRRKPNAEKHIALLLANYPTRDGRIGNGVGLDTPASTISILEAMRRAGYRVGETCEDGDALVRLLLSGVTNDTDRHLLRSCSQALPLDAYLEHFQALPQVNRDALTERWGPPQADPAYRDGALMVPGIRFGNVFVGIQPARGFNIDLAANYHDPDLVPPHGYLAFYLWLRHSFGADAVAHIGKHGNLEWLPGKSIGLAEDCWPDAVLGPLPHLYPFIVNDPGEGAQAKRRTQAVILDHLTPPMARAETYGELQALEALIDEYYEAHGLDAPRERYLRGAILELLRSANLDRELGLELSSATCEQEALNQVDAYLCELKEAQIRHGLHRFGEAVPPQKQAETLVALTRLPRGEEDRDIGFLHALSADLGLQNPSGRAFDPLEFTAADRWTGPRPDLLLEISDSPWRTAADTRERLELLAERLVDDALARRAPPPLHRTAKLLQFIVAEVAPAIGASTRDELDNFVHALDGGFVPAGPSGAPTRGRLDVLPTGRNFYALDARSIPTPAAWELGQRSAAALVQRHLQEHGDHPARLGISVWGTATMRTGGDDIAQAFALMGVRPVWARGSRRVVDVEVVPGFQLDHPRVDVTLRISGFFRDAFPNVIRLFDTAVQALADYEEPGGLNTIRRHIDEHAERLRSDGVEGTEAVRQARLRVFGSRPGSYGAGLQGLIDERIWEDPSDLARAYVNWGGYGYSATQTGVEAHAAFEHQIASLDGVVQNQDNREHDLLDSDDYYQFQGGMANAARVLSGTLPPVYHGDHADPARPRMRTLKEELDRVIRSRVVNPKWITAMREHGYKGAFEMAASVDYLFAYDATTGLIDDYQYEAVTDALVLDGANSDFLKASNPDALKEMTERLLEAQQRGLWDASDHYRQALSDALVEFEEVIEQRAGS